MIDESECLLDVTRNIIGSMHAGMTKQPNETSRQSYPTNLRVSVNYEMTSSHPYNKTTQVKVQQHPFWKNSARAVDFSDEFNNTDTCSPEYFSCGLSDPSNNPQIERTEKVNANDKRMSHPHSKPSYQMLSDGLTTTTGKKTNFLAEMERQDDECFEEYMSHEQSKFSSSRLQSQDEMMQEKLFGNSRQYVPKYAYEIIQNLIKQQDKFNVSSEVKDPTQHQNLIDLMSVVHHRLKLEGETFFLASNLFSRYIEHVTHQHGQVVKTVTVTAIFSLTRLILLVSASLFIAAKYQEIYPPSLRDFQAVLQQYVGIGLNVQSAILECEGVILNTLQFQLFGPTRLYFFQAFSSQVSLDSSQKNFCLYLLEISQLFHGFYKYQHSEIAASVILLSEKFKNISGKYFWNENLGLLTNKGQYELYACVEDLYHCLLVVGKDHRNLHIFNKYADPVYSSVSQIDYDINNHSVHREETNCLANIPQINHQESLNFSIQSNDSAHDSRACSDLQTSYWLNDMPSAAESMGQPSQFQRDVNPSYYSQAEGFCNFQDDCDDISKQFAQLNPPMFDEFD